MAAMTAREAELAALVSEQERDERYGHRVFSVSLNAARSFGDEERPEMLALVTVDEEGVARVGTRRHVLTFRQRSSDGAKQRIIAPPFDSNDASDPRHGTETCYVNLRCHCDKCRVARTDAIRSRPSYQSILANQRALKERYSGTCRNCGAATTGCNGRAKAPRLCLACTNKRREAKHGTLSKYSGGCRCFDCRYASGVAHSALKGRTPPTHGYSGYVNYACRCDVCRAAGSEANRRARERRLAQEQAA